MGEVTRTMSHRAPTDSQGSRAHRSHLPLKRRTWTPVLSWAGFTWPTAVTAQCFWAGGQGQQNPDTPHSFTSLTVLHIRRARSIRTRMLLVRTSYALQLGLWGGSGGGTTASPPSPFLESTRLTKGPRPAKWIPDVSGAKTVCFPYSGER